MYANCNPGGVRNAGGKRLFIDRSYRNSEKPSDYVFIPAKVTDNPVLLESNPQYLETLENLPEHLKKAYLDGNWDVLEGQYFAEFERSRHVVKPTELPKEWKRFRAMDWGYNDPCCVLWFAVAPEGRLYVYRELYVRKTLSSEIAKRVKALSEGERIAYTVAAPDAWQHRGLKGVEGTCIAEVFSKNGVPLLPADNARIPGWQRVRENLAPCADGTPNLRIFETCRNLIRTLPGLTYDAHDPEDVSDTCEDHAPEALRYGLMSRPRASEPQQPRTVRRYNPLSTVLPEANGFCGL
jgi:phage terminase large subunit